MVTFVLEDIRDLELNGFSHQNVLSELILRKDTNGYTLELGPSFGICGTINAGSVSIELEPPKPLG